VRSPSRIQDQPEHGQAFHPFPTVILTLSQDPEMADLRA
jgi:hypothetical protein